MERERGTQLQIVFYRAGDEIQEFVTEKVKGKGRPGSQVESASRYWWLTQKVVGRGREAGVLVSVEFPGSRDRVAPVGDLLQGWECTFGVVTKTRMHLVDKEEVLGRE